LGKLKKRASHTEKPDSGGGEFKLMTLDDTKKVKKSLTTSGSFFHATFIRRRNEKKNEEKSSRKEGKNVSFSRCVRNCALGRMMVIVLLSSLPQHSFCWRTTISRR
jgi:hypothetical protein